MQEAQEAQQARWTAPNAPKEQPLYKFISIPERMNWEAEPTHGKTELLLLLSAQAQVLPQQRNAHDRLCHVEATFLAVHRSNDEEGADLIVGGGEIRNAQRLPRHSGHEPR